MRRTISERYAQARAEPEYPWGYAPADDMTGAYVDRGDLARLLKSPTQATALAVYERQMDHWFEAGPDVIERRRQGLDGQMRSDPMLAGIADRCVRERPAVGLD